MALAWLELVGVDRGALRFTIDTGTNRYYQLRVGRSRTSREGFDWVDEVHLTTPIGTNTAGGSMLPATREVTVPASRLARGDAYVQLVTYKTPDGRGPAFSRVVPLNSGVPAIDGRLLDIDSSIPVAAAMTLTQAPFQTPRRIPCAVSPDQLAREQSIDELLSGILKVAGPIVVQLLSGTGSAGAAGGTGGTTDTSAQVGSIVTALLRTLLSGAQPTANTAAPSLAKPQSFAMQLSENRFAAAKRAEWSQPFIAGIDDALLISLAGPILSALPAIAGPVLNLLPQLMNSANQARLQTSQANAKLAGDALAQVNQRMIMEQLLQAQQKSSGDQAAQLAQLRQLLQQASDAAAQAPAKAQSLSASRAFSAPSEPAAAPSPRAVLSFVAAEPLEFNGRPHVLFARDHDAEFKVRFTVGEPVPKSALPRAKLTLTFKGTHHPSDWIASTTNLTDVAPNGVVTATVPRSQLARLPGNRRIAVVAELRWPSPRSGVKPYSATGSTDIVLVDRYFVRERGATSGEERELTDMTQFRPFWNKIWEAPSLDAINRGNDGRASLWELDANARYVVLLTPHDQANGLMETKLKTTPPDPEAITLKIDGRLKGGVELSLSEINKLASQWAGQTPLDAARLAAMSSHAVACANSGEVIARLRLRGSKDDRGMIWVVPVFQLAGFTLSVVQKTDDSGQVIAVGEEQVRFPVPVAVRVLGLKSGTGGDNDKPDEPHYSFDGYNIELSQKIMLTPLEDRRREGTGDRIAS